MGKVFSSIVARDVNESVIPQLLDKAFYEIAAFDPSKSNDERTINFSELYIGILLYYNEINKKLKGTHSDPPSRKEVAKLLEKFDTNKDGVLDREEFGKFVEQFSKTTAKQVATNVAIGCILVPTLVYITKKALKPVDTVGPVVDKIPGAVLASGYFLVLSASGLKLV